MKRFQIQSFVWKVNGKMREMEKKKLSYQIEHKPNWMATMIGSNVQNRTLKVVFISHVSSFFFVLFSRWNWPVSLAISQCHRVPLFHDCHLFSESNNRVLYTHSKLTKNYSPFRIDHKSYTWNSIEVLSNTKIDNVCFIFHHHNFDIIANFRYGWNSSMTQLIRAGV